ncbi:MAG: HAD hydrolase-like protein [Victivallales bacterium]
MYFTEIFGPANLGFRKNSVDFYKQLIAAGNFRPEEMLIIGDDIEADREMPHKAGIEHTVLIDRKRQQHKNDIFTVDDLRNILNQQEQK